MCPKGVSHPVPLLNIGRLFPYFHEVGSEFAQRPEHCFTCYVFRVENHRIAESENAHFLRAKLKSRRQLHRLKVFVPCKRCYIHF